MWGLETLEQIQDKQIKKNRNKLLVTCPECKGIGNHKRKTKPYKAWHSDTVPCRRCRGATTIKILG